MLDVKTLSPEVLMALLVVLAGLILLVGIIALYKASKLRQPVQQLQEAVTAPGSAPIMASPAQDAALVAAITAALSCFLEQETATAAAAGAPAPQGFVARRIRRIH